MLKSASVFIGSRGGVNSSDISELFETHAPEQPNS